MASPDPRFPRRRALRWAGLAMLGGLLLSPSSARAEELYLGRWVPSDNQPFTMAQQERLREDGGICMEIINKRAAARASVFRPGKDEDEGLGDGIDPVFADCMQGHGWVSVDDAEFQARQVRGGAEDCLLGIQTECAEYVNLYIHGEPRLGLVPSRGIEVGETLCRRGDGDVCMTLSSLYLHTNPIHGLERSPTTALAYAQRGCDLDSARACAFAGMLLTTDIDGLPKDGARGRRFLDRACELGNDGACRPSARPSTALPRGARWCHYGLAPDQALDGCPTVDASWISLPSDQACRQEIRISVDRCERVYVLGEADASSP